MGLSSAIPALPVQDIDAATASYSAKFGFSVVHADDGFAKLVRDDAEIHLWASSDDSWRDRTDFVSKPVCSGAESFIAGTASCRIQVDNVDALYAELSQAGVLHPTDHGSAVDTDWGTREFATLDLEGNLLTFFARRTS
ncbi:bleomycin resistance protein [Aeromicrobium sp. Sec7.5]|uniref:bleomycin resistance protein n=1 Tax=Aeromicrobium sp. Sec7.5 TaxID=3121276 RepID=UPI002FE4E784